MVREMASASRKFGAEIARPVHLLRRKNPTIRVRDNALECAFAGFPGLRIVSADPDTCCWTPTKHGFSRCGMRLAGTSGIEGSRLAVGLANEEMGR